MLTSIMMTDNISTNKDDEVKIDLFDIEMEIGKDNDDDDGVAKMPSHSPVKCTKNQIYRVLQPNKKNSMNKHGNSWLD